jgi:hypothetical protein
MTCAINNYNIKIQLLMAAIHSESFTEDIFSSFIEYRFGEEFIKFFNTAIIF